MAARCASRCYRRAVDRRRRILDAAAESFHEKGFHGVGVDEIGRRAGLSGPSIYRHFSGKDEILATLLDEAMDELVSAATTSGDDPARDLERALRHHLDFARRRADLVTLYQREARSLVEPWRTAFRARRAVYAGAWEQLVSRRFPETPESVAATIAQVCLGAVFSLPGWPSKARGKDATEVVLTMLLEGAAGQAVSSEADPSC